MEKIVPVDETVGTVRTSTFALIINALKGGPKSREELAKILFSNRTKESMTFEEAKAQTPIRLVNLRKRGYVIVSKDKQYHLLGKKVTVATDDEIPAEAWAPATE